MENFSRFRCFYAVYRKETVRFLSMWGQTIVGPIITAMLFLLIFSVSFRAQSLKTNFIEFLVPGLIMMQIIQNSFANTSSSMLQGKIFRTLNDLLMSPLKPYQIVFAYILSSVTRGFLVGAVLFIVMWFFVDFSVNNWYLLLYFLFMSSFFMGSLGMLLGLFSAKFDQLANISNLIITPLSFLSGTFYSVKSLPTFFYHLTKFNPFFYMIDGFRSGFLGYSDFNIHFEVLIIAIFDIALLLVCIFVLRKGYKVKN